MAGHTPGPWHICKLPINQIGVATEEGAGICEITRHVGQLSEADARLIAAAPTLLAAVEAAFDSWYDDPRHREMREPAWVGMARAALASVNEAS